MLHEIENDTLLDDKISDIKLPTVLKPVEVHSSDFRTFGNTIISFVGSGVLGLPFAFRQTGFALGLAILLFVAAVSTYAMFLIIRCKYALKNKGHICTTYGQVAQYAYGDIGSTIVNVLLVVTQSGFCIAYVIFIATNIHALFGIAKVIVIIALIPGLIILAFVKHLKNLAPFALFADGANLLGLAVVYLSDFEYMPLDHDLIQASIPEKIPFFFGVAIYCFEGVGMILPLENSMQNKHNFKTILLCTIALITCLYGTFGLCGYLAFGNETLDVITLNMPGSFLSQVVKLSLCIGLYFTYPMMLFPVFQVLEGYILKSHTSERKSKLIRANTVISTAIVAALVPNFGLFISFLGSTCCSFLAFILPAMFYYKLCRAQVTFVEYGILAVILAIGITSFATGVLEACQHIF